MAYGIVDISVSDQMEDTAAALVLDCYNSFPHDLDSIRSGVSVVMKNNNTERSVRLYREQGDECGFPYLELSSAAAKALGLKDGYRYQIDYNEMGGTLTFRRVTLSRVMAPIDVSTDRSREAAVTMGYSILSMLGLAEQRGSYVSVKKGGTTHKLRLIVPENELDEEVWLSPAAAAKLGISGGNEHLLEYSQSSRVLYVDGASPSESSAAVKRTGSSRTKRTTASQGSVWTAKTANPASKKGKNVWTLRYPAGPKKSPGPAAPARRSSRKPGSLQKQGAWLSSSKLAPRSR
ncbi:hypothetical protein ACVNS2_29980 [Paenibacillus caseinilyticus]|uniref:Uncharacterized protein n=1 Tax=Paenibacillus mucilaginosus K02 TaxID=997761 RepID=I0BRD8_9BACL|nr:hypothetical protein [Paenibacillus mucilaginosus]AFH64935.1 hypothetical protein B2K_30245 [Paenibacillus mucilaginosus K02]